MTTTSAQPASTTRPSKGLGISLWIVQGLLAMTFVGTGLWKLAALEEKRRTHRSTSCS